VSLDQNQKKSFKNLKSGSRSSEVYDIVKEAIIRGEWEPGDRIDDKELSIQLSVNRLTVREALSKLTENKIIEHVHWKGFYLRNIPIEEVWSIIEIRISLETLAITNTMKRSDLSFYEKLEKLILSSEKAIEANNHEEFMKKDFLFHSTIYKQSGNPWIESIIENLRLLINILRNVSMKPNFKEAAIQSTADHKTICSLMKNGNKEEAIIAMTNHMELFYKNTIKELTQKQLPQI
jgi:DNA-binding GntR family transcriptional regulator